MPRQYNPHIPEEQRPCSRCGNARDRKGQRLCRACHAANMRATRPKNSALPHEAWVKQIARAKTRVYVTRGWIERKPCEVCSSVESQAHHDDYTKWKEVRWLCRPCHLQHHATEDATKAA